MWVRKRPPTWEQGRREEGGWRASSARATSMVGRRAPLGPPPWHRPGELDSGGREAHGMGDGAVEEGTGRGDAGGWG